MLKQIAIISVIGFSIHAMLLSEGFLLGNAVAEAPPQNGTHVQHHHNGTETIRIETPYKNGKIEGLLKQFFESGTLASEAEYRASLPNGRYVVYQKNGKKELEGNYKNGQEHGTFRQYKKDGSLHMQWKMKDGVEQPGRKMF